MLLLELTGERSMSQSGMISCEVVLVWAGSQALLLGWQGLALVQAATQTLLLGVGDEGQQACVGDVQVLDASMFSPLEE